MQDFSDLNDLTFFSTNRGWCGYENSELDNRTCVLYRNANYDVISAKCKSGVRILRDPRSVVCSAYFSHLNSHRIEDWIQLRKQRKLLKQFNEADGFRLTLAFLERSDFYHGTAGPLNVMSSWMFGDKRYTVLRAEDYFKDPVTNLHRTIVANGLDPNHFKYPNAANYSFKSISGREVGEIDSSSHYRSGDLFDWNDKLPDDVVAYLESHYSNIIGTYYTS